MPQLRLPESAARQLLLVRAIESEDREGAVLTREDRQYATSAALVDGAPDDGGRRVASFLHRRSALALDRLLPRFPVLRQACGLSRWPAWVNWAVPLAALVLGFVSHRLDGERLNILAFPLLGMLLWNAAVYLWSLVSWLRPGREGHPLLGALAKLGSPFAARLSSQPTLERGVARFARDWSTAATPLTAARAKRTLHLGAALFALGIIAGMLIRARYTAEYRAGWAGTWSGAETEIGTFLSVVFAPAAALTGLPLPTPERLRALRGGSENAGDWLLLWATTAALFVIIPRLLLAAWSASRAALLARSLKLPGEEDFYVRTLLRNALGQPGTARIIPYATTPSVPGRERLERLLGQALGEKVRVGFDPPVPYGEEERWLASEGERLAHADQLVLLFSLASTPEAENHGAFARAVATALSGRGTGLTLLVDDSAFRERLRGQPSAQRRLDERTQAWRQVLLPTGQEPVILSLELGEEEVGARTLEKALQRAPVPA
ncbi:DUF2868 domain-containing protein [Sphingomonas sp. BN140010]|uniref:DUF2868 domain-containing protein n=1 Tax=Sphingomonas arvum TaxID=2992113 RepID=A0ABT3JF97_9SPHN|nr:DUF2868 domain-containing protein [Sphingomonas sp. BN140010]MCW3797752.1 DUF2868 domain-containing protein [Sphingomonas sp. BN140010]